MPAVNLDPRTPVLVGAGVAGQRLDDPSQSLEALELMVQALEAAALDAGSTALLGAAQQISVPEGTWSYADPGRLLSDRFGATARTVLADVGILQQDVLGDACAQIATGAIDVCLVVGGETRHRAVRSRVTGTPAPETVQPDGVVADRRWTTSSLGVHDLEIIRNAVTPATSYALIEHARMHHLGRSTGEHRRALGELGASFAAVASGNPDAWDRHRYSADEVVMPTPANRMISSPYTKVMCSQWNVDQAAGFILCSVAAAERFGVARDRWVFPLTSVVSNHAVPVLQRPELHRSPGSGVAGARALELAALDADSIAHVDLYSCFPSAVEALAEALSMPAGRELTVTGGMSLAGGPLNNYVLQALAVLVPRLREEPMSVGLSSSVSGFLVKQGFGLWSATPGASASDPGAFVHEDVSAAAEAADDAPRPVDAEHVGPAEVVSWTVDHQSGEPFRAVVVCDTPSGARTLASTGDTAVCVAMLDGDWTGQPVSVRRDGSFSW